MGILCRYRSCHQTQDGLGKDGKMNFDQKYRKLCTCGWKGKWYSKSAHDDEESAEVARLLMEEKTGESYNVYRCEYCHKFHIGRTRKHDTPWNAPFIERNRVKIPLKKEKPVLTANDFVPLEWIVKRK